MKLMGQYVSFLSRSDFTSRWIAEKFMKPITWMIEPTLIVKKSTIPGAGDGLYTNTTIPEGSIFLLKDEPMVFKINDPLFSMGTLIDCYSNYEMYHRLYWINRDYHNEDTASKQLNCKYVSAPNVDGFIALKTIHPNNEIFRAYALQTWLAIGTNSAAEPVLDSLNSKNVVGFAYFLREWVTNHGKDPYTDVLSEIYQSILTEATYLTGVDYNTDTIKTLDDLQQYDQLFTMKSIDRETFRSRILTLLRPDTVITQMV